jgi:mRNA-degrading endonuclease RelE of RelBE toxin-antitoxin system
VPKYRIIAHRRVHKFLSSLKDERLRHTVVDCIAKLDDYPLVLRELDVEKIKGMQKTFRVRVGKFRIILHVDDTEKTIYVTHVEARKKAYTKLE